MGSFRLLGHRGVNLDTYCRLDGLPEETRLDPIERGRENLARFGELAALIAASKLNLRELARLGTRAIACKDATFARIGSTRAWETRLGECRLEDYEGFVLAFCRKG